MKGLYRKARNGEIPNFTGVSSPYEKPVSPDLEINTEVMSIEDAVTLIIDKMENSSEKEA